MSLCCPRNRCPVTQQCRRWSLRYRLGRRGEDLLLWKTTAQRELTSQGRWISGCRFSTGLTSLPLLLVGAKEEIPEKTGSPLHGRTNSDMEKPLRWRGLFQDTGRRCVNSKRCKTGCWRKCLWGEGKWIGAKESESGWKPGESNLLPQPGERSLLRPELAFGAPACYTTLAHLSRCEKKATCRTLLRNLVPGLTELGSDPVVTGDATARPLHCMDQDGQTCECSPWA